MAGRQCEFLGKHCRRLPEKQTQSLHFRKISQSAHEPIPPNLLATRDLQPIGSNRAALRFFDMAGGGEWRARNRFAGNADRNSDKKPEGAKKPFQNRRAGGVSPRVS